jgi:DNA-binding NtrC family response regulator
MVDTLHASPALGMVLEGTMEDTIRHLREAQAMAGLVGSSPVFRNAIAQLPTIARSDAPVLICGETGTGKELVARAFHYLSERAGEAFVAINCGSFPETLLEDELFGHERGAFTDAHSRREGLIAQAEHGTLFLDEVDTLSPKAQVNFLRVLQDKKFRKIGSVTEQPCDIRVLAATNAPLDELVHSRNFRIDLYYRLCVFAVHLPPLRTRQEDIPALAAHFLDKHCPPERREGLKFSTAALAAMASWPWPGNVRELENAVIRGIHLCRGHVIETEDMALGIKRLASHATHSSPSSLSLRELKKTAVEAFERDYLVRLLVEHQGNLTRAAREAKKDRRDFGKLLKKYQLDPKSFRAA